MLLLQLLLNYLILFLERKLLKAEYDFIYPNIKNVAGKINLYNVETIKKKAIANNNYDMDKKVKLSDTVDSIISKIINKIKNNKIKIKNEEQAIIDYLVSIFPLNTIYLSYRYSNTKLHTIFKSVTRMSFHPKFSAK